MTTFLLQKSLKIPGVSRQVLLELRRNNVILEQSGLLPLPDIEHESLLYAVVEGSDLLSQSQVSIHHCAKKSNFFLGQMGPQIFFSHLV